MTCPHGGSGRRSPPIRNRHARVRFAYNSTRSSTTPTSENVSLERWEHAPTIRCAKRNLNPHDTRPSSVREIARYRGTHDREGLCFVEPSRPHGQHKSEDSDRPVDLSPRRNWHSCPLPIGHPVPGCRLSCPGNRDPLGRVDRAITVTELGSHTTLAGETRCLVRIEDSRNCINPERPGQQKNNI